jgi:predicted small lipoprotein YifL
MAQSSTTPARPRGAALTAAVALLLTGCGRIGPLEPPPDTNAPPKPAQTAEEATLNPQVKPKIPPVTPPKQPFILDPLLK